MVANEKYNSIDIEEGLLGLILISKSSQEKALIDLKIEDFTTISNQIIMKNVASLFNDGLSISLVTLKDSLKKNNELTKIGGDKFLDKLLLKNVSKMHVNDYLRIIKENAKIRKVKNVLMNAVKYIDTTDIKDVEEIVHNVESDILLATRDAQKIEQRSFEEILTTVVEKIDANKKNEGVTGIETGFSQLDNLTSGFHDGDFIILAARPSMGKTALALSMATNVAKQSPVYMFSLEMPSEQLAQRMISTIAHVDGGKLRKPKFLTPMDWSKIYKGKEELAKREIIIDETSGIKLTDIVWKCRKRVRDDGVKLIIIDYLQLIAHDVKSNNRQEEVSIISRTLKELARELNIPIVALSQLSRRVETREDKRPLMSDLRESGSIEQDADLIMFLFRGAYYDKEKSAPLQDVELIISKHRNGPTGTAELMFELNTGVFKDK